MFARYSVHLCCVLCCTAFAGPGLVDRGFDPDSSLYQSSGFDIIGTGLIRIIFVLFIWIASGYFIILIFEKISGERHGLQGLATLVIIFYGIILLVLLFFDRKLIFLLGIPAIGILWLLNSYLSNNIKNIPEKFTEKSETVTEKKISPIVAKTNLSSSIHTGILEKSDRAIHGRSSFESTHHEPASLGNIINKDKKLQAISLANKTEVLAILCQTLLRLRHQKLTVSNINLDGLSKKYSNKYLNTTEDLESLAEGENWWLDNVTGDITDSRSGRRYSKSIIKIYQNGYLISDEIWVRKSDVFHTS
jgi:hypothetical protein